MSQEQARDITLSVPDISCGHCVQTINKTLQQMPGITQVATDLPTKTVHLLYQPEKVSLTQIEEALDEAGYTVAR